MMVRSKNVQADANLKKGVYARMKAEAFLLGPPSVCPNPSLMHFLNMFAWKLWSSEGTTWQSQWFKAAQLLRKTDLSTGP